MIATCIIVRDEGFNLPFKLPRQVMVFEQGAVLERTVPALDLALCLWVVRLATRLIIGPQ